MSQPALLERDGSERQRIAIPVQLVFAVVIAAHVVALSMLGGAVLARYMLPVLPLVILICVSTLRRRLRHWVWCVVAVCAAFVFALLTPPPYRIAPEDTLLYRDYVILHKQAETEIARRYPHARVLTAWPASDEMTRPFLGYVKQPMDVIRVENFSEAEMERAARATGEFDIVFLFTTKWQPPHPLLQSAALRRGAAEALLRLPRRRHAGARGGCWADASCATRTAITNGWRSSPSSGWRMRRSFEFPVSSFK